MGGVFPGHPPLTEAWGVGWTPDTIVWNQRRDSHVLLAAGGLFINGFNDRDSNELLGVGSENNGSPGSGVSYPQERDKGTTIEKGWQAEGEGNEGSFQYGVWKSVDEGRSWTKVETGSGLESARVVYSVDLAVAPTGQVLLAAKVLDSKSQDSYLLSQSEDGGETWQVANDPEPGTETRGIIYLGNHLGEE